MRTESRSSRKGRIDRVSGLTSGAQCYLLCDWSGKDVDVARETRLTEWAWWIVLTGFHWPREKVPAEIRDRAFDYAEGLLEIKAAITPRLWHWAVARLTERRP